MTDHDPRGCSAGAVSDCGLARQGAAAHREGPHHARCDDPGHSHDHHPHRHHHGGDHGHHHGAGHDHDHHRALGKKGLLIVLLLTGTFMIIEFVGGLLSNSLALLADSAHMLTDVAAIALSLFALSVARRPATPEKTFGYLRIEILAALVNGATLIVLSLFIFYEAYQRLRSPAEVESGLMLAVALAGLLVNLAAAGLLHRSAGHSLNVRGAYLHVLGDLLGSVGAIAAALVIMATGWEAADPLISVFVGVLILISSWKLVRESADILLEAAPRHLDMGEVRRTLEAVPGVEDVHDLHVWTLTSGFLAMSGHAVVCDPAESQRILEEIHRRMDERFGIRHITFQLECPPAYRQESPPRAG